MKKLLLILTTAFCLLANAQTQKETLNLVSLNQPSGFITLIGFQLSPLIVSGSGAIATPTGGAKYYVDATASASTGAGTLANPYITLTQVVSNMANFHAGDSILFRAGTSYQAANNSFVISCSGNSTYPIVFCSYKGPDSSSVPPYFQCAATPNTSVIDNRHVIDVTGSYVTLDGLDMIDLATDVNDHTIDARVGYGIWNTGNNNTFRNLHISRVGDCICITTGKRNNLIEKCLLENGRMIVDTWSPIYDDYGANGVVIEGPNNTVRYNTLKDLWATTFDFSATANPSTSTVRNGYDGGAWELYGSNLDSNVFSYNTVINCRGFLETGNNQPNSHAANMLISYNKFINIGTMGALHGKYTDPVISNLQYYNNDFIEDFAVPYNFSTNASQYLAFADSAAFQPSTNAVIAKNNIFYMNTGQKFTTSGNISSFKAGQFVHTNNVIKWGTGPLNFTPDASDYSTTSAIAIFNDTTTGNPVNWDCTPGASSKAINYGIDVGLVTDFAGHSVLNNPDAGILERTFNVITQSATDVLIDGSNFIWASSFAQGKSVYLEIIGSGSDATIGATATLYTLAGVAVPGSATAIGTTSTIGRSTALTLTDGVTYQIRWKATGDGTAYLKTVRLIVK